MPQTVLLGAAARMPHTVSLGAAACLRQLLRCPPEEECGSEEPLQRVAGQTHRGMAHGLLVQGSPRERDIEEIKNRRLRSSLLLREKNCFNSFISSL